MNTPAIDEIKDYLSRLSFLPHEQLTNQTKLLMRAVVEYDMKLAAQFQIAENACADRTTVAQELADLKRQFMAQIATLQVVHIKLRTKLDRIKCMATVAGDYMEKGDDIMVPELIQKITEEAEL